MEQHNEARSNESLPAHSRTRTVSSSMKRGAALLAIAAALAVPVARAQIAAPVEVDDGVNSCSLGVASVPDYMGSSHNRLAVGPAVRYAIPDSERYFMLLGPQAMFNILDDANWRFGPLVNYRGARDDTVEDAVVQQMQKIDGKFEIGVFAAYRLKLSAERMHQINFGTDLAGDEEGVIGSLRAMYWQPLTQSTIVNLGVGTILASRDWMQTYFGVNGERDIALFPSLGGKPFEADGGVRSITVPFGLTQALSRQWLVSVGGRYERLVGDAADSPVTSERGSSSQWIGGVGSSYLF
jgi:outer membrane scaffolding protein for murein synthesis (MipA/OmpV family)